MPRDKQLVFPDVALHIISRGNNRQDIFRENRDKFKYYQLLSGFKGENKIDILHYCLMSNHVHLIIWLSPQSTLSRFMKQVNLSYFRHYQKFYGYSGHLWQDRFKSHLVEKDSYLLQCGKYIELNPVRAGLVNFPEEYRFSSYRYYALGENDFLVTPNPLYLELSHSESTRRKRYIEFVID